MEQDVLKECEDNSELLKIRQGYSLKAKIHLTNKRIKEWYDFWEGKVYVSFSGGKDSTVVLDLVRKLYPEVPAVFVDTGLEYPEVKQFVKQTENVVWLRPKYSFKEVLEKYGYPVVSKDCAKKIYEYRTTKSAYLKERTLIGDKKGNGKLPKKWWYLFNAPFKISSQCCDVMKKSPIKKYERKTKSHGILGILANESKLRKVTYLKYGCNTYDGKRARSFPIAFWLEKDVWEYLKTKKVPYCSIYNKGYDRTGCMFCMFGVNLEKSPNRFQKMKQTHPKIWEYCMFKLGLDKILRYMKINADVNQTELKL